jgi:4-amino-4-deoxy-L-arabinose transferase-like glycosyltransferase
VASCPTFRPTLLFPALRIAPRPPLDLFGLVLLCGALFFPGLGTRELTSSHEARAAQNALCIVTEGCWGLPHLLDGGVEMQKPPLYYWMVAGLVWLRGGVVDGWAVRLPAALAALATVLTVFGLGAATGRRTAGFIAAAVLASMVHFTHLAQVGRIDMPLCLCATLALLGYFLGQRDALRATRWYVLSYVAFAAGLMLKGPIALVLPGCIIVVHQFRRTDFQPVRREQRFGLLRSTLWGVPLMFALAAPWYVAAGFWTGGDFFRVFFWYHNFQRGFGGDGPLAVHPWWYYGPRLAADTLPWGLALPPLIWYGRRKGLWRQDAEARFGLTWLLSMTVLLSLMRFKRADYLLPAYPGLAVFLGCLAERWYKACGEPRAWRLAFLTALLGMAVGWQVYRAAAIEGATERHHRVFAEELRRRVPPRVPVIFFRVEAHQLAFHLGRRYNTVLEWENLNTWAGSGKNFFVVLSPECERELPAKVTSGGLARVLDSRDLFPEGRAPDRPLVMLRNAPTADTVRRR